MANPYQVNTEEQYYMRGLPHLARLTYFYLRSHMDYKTGITGLARRVTLKSIAEYLYVEPHQGIKGGEPSQKEIRNALNWLEKAGLIKRDTTFNRATKQSVFKLCLATTDNYARNKVDNEKAKKEGKEQDKERAKEEPSNINGSNDFLNPKEGSKADNEKNSKVGNPPNISDKKNIYNDTAPFSMYDGWLPDWQSFKNKTVRTELKNPVPKEILKAFKELWIKRPEIECTLREWEEKLFRFYLDKHVRGKANASYTSSSKQGKESLIERTNRKLDDWVNS